MNHRVAFTLLFAAAIALASPSPTAAQRNKAKAPKQAERKTTPHDRDGSSGALDNRLLDDLDNLPAGRDRSEPRQGDAAPRSGPPSEGEDIGAREPADQLARIGQQMLAAEKRMAAKDSSGETERLQQQILAELDELIDQARQGGGTSQPSDRSKRPGQKNAAQRPGDEAGRRDGQPAPAGNDQGQGGDPSPDGLQDLVDRVWGHLPDRLRKGVLNPSVEQFLPEYESLIESYYRRLAEDDETRP